MENGSNLFRNVLTSAASSCHCAPSPHQARLQPPGRRPSPQPQARSASASQHRRSNSDVSKSNRPLNDGGDARRSAVLAFELANAMDGCEIRTGFDVLIGSNGEPYPVLNRLLITLPVLRTANNLIVRRVREPVLTSKNIQVRACRL